ALLWALNGDFTTPDGSLNSLVERLTPDLLASGLEKFKERFATLNRVVVAVDLDPVFPAHQRDAKYSFDFRQVACVVCIELAELPWIGKMKGLFWHRLLRLMMAAWLLTVWSSARSVVTDDWQLR
ncbi:MAG: hypothetical protein ACPGKS_08500, partial [Coraliomargarita sp.]